MYIMEISHSWLKKAQRHLDTAELLFNKGFSASIADIVYMAMFSAAKALLVKKGIECSTHEGLIYLFKINYVDRGLFNRELFKQFCRSKELKTRYFNFAFDGITKEEVWEALNSSRDFIDHAGDLI